MGIFSRALPDSFVTGPKTGHQRILRIGVRLAISLAHRLHRQAAGFFAALVTAHPIRYYGKPSLAPKFLVALRLPIAKVVLVAVPLQANVG